MSDVPLWLGFSDTDSVRLHRSAEQAGRSPWGASSRAEAEDRRDPVYPMRPSLSLPHPQPHPCREEQLRGCGPGGTPPGFAGPSTQPFKSRASTLSRELRCLPRWCSSRCHPLFATCQAGRLPNVTELSGQISQWPSFLPGLR